MQIKITKYKTIKTFFGNCIFQLPKIRMIKIERQFGKEYTMSGNYWYQSFLSNNQTTMDNTSEKTSSAYSIFTNLSKTIEDGKKETIQSMIINILQCIKEKSMLGKSDDCLYLMDYDYEDYSDDDFYSIVNGIQNELYKYNVKIKGGWSTKFRSLYIYIQWNKQWKNYWFFGKRRYYG